MLDEKNKTARLEARVSVSVYELLQKAAAIQGRSMTDFVVSAAREAAEEAIKGHAMIELSLDDQQPTSKVIMSNCPEPPATPTVKYGLKIDPAGKYLPLLEVLSTVVRLNVPTPALLFTAIKIDSPFCLTPEITRDPISGLYTLLVASAKKETPAILATNCPSPAVISPPPSMTKSPSKGSLSHAVKVNANRAKSIQLSNCNFFID
ncbi:MAG: hypothetical protein COA78_13970 [Blastopirellula sp.]|nr:MAG: hypothetical protein COA78_13970 [Blastopirellula sp.]